MHVKISSHLGSILDSMSSSYHLSVTAELTKRQVIYGTKDQGRGKFIHGVQNILANLAETSITLTERLPIETQRPVDTLSRVAATLHILTHQVSQAPESRAFRRKSANTGQCIILAVRPVLFSLLSLKLSSSRPLRLSDPINALLRMCVESAFNILKIMFALKSQNLSGRI